MPRHSSRIFLKSKPAHAPSNEEREQPLFSLMPPAGRICRALFPFYRQVSQLGRRCSTAPAQPVTSGGAFKGRSGKTPPQVEIISQLHALLL